MPRAVTTASPRRLRPAKEKAAPLSGMPAKRARNFPTRPYRSRNSPAAKARGTHARFGEGFGPAAIGAETWPARAAQCKHNGIGPLRNFLFGVAKRRLRSLSQPCQGWRGRKATPRAASRRSHARSKGEALKEAGNTRPLEPMKVGWPSSSHQAMSACGGNASSAGRRCGAAAP